MMCPEGMISESMRYLVLSGNVALVAILHFFEFVFKALELNFHCFHKLQISLGSLIQNLNGLTHVLNLDDNYIQTTAEIFGGVWEFQCNG